MRCLFSRSTQRPIVFALAVLANLLPTHGQSTPTEDPVSSVRMPTGQVLSPAGEMLPLAGRPNDLAYHSGSNRLLVKNHKSLNVIDTQDWSIEQTLNLPGGASLVGIVADSDGNVFVSNAAQQVQVYSSIMPSATDAPSMQHTFSLEMPKDSFPCGLALSGDESELYVCLSKTNQVAFCNLAALRELLATADDDGDLPKSLAADALKLETVEAGIAPFDVEWTQHTSKSTPALIVSNIGGRRAEDDDETAPSAGTETPINKAGIANTSLVNIIDVATRSVVRSVATDLHPTEVLLLPSDRTSQTVLVTNTNADSITWIDCETAQTQTTLSKPLEDLPYGSMPNVACVSPDGRFAFVALAGNNAVAVYTLANGENAGQNPLINRNPFANAIGFIPTGWFPAGLACSSEHLFVANLKGLGSRNTVRADEKGRNSHDHLGSLQRIPLADIADGERLAEWTLTVKRQSGLLPQARIDLAQQGAAAVAPKPIPDKLGEPSVFRHVIYVIKENRTYDQVFGDFAESRSEPSLCVFPEFNTPNHHALARRFGILDNYYCNGVLSADGHSWATEGNVTPYLERAFGGFSRSYTFGDDPITYSSSGFLWDRFLDAGLSFRNYGEMDYAKPPAGMDYQALWKAREAGERIVFSQEIGIDRLRRYSCRDYPGWNMTIPDALRMDRFLEEFEEYKTNSTLPNLCIVYLPQDHFGGGVTSAAHMADNDLALGRLVEAVSHSDYWKNTLIIANEDDPQNGYDHIDGHRSICLVVSAYSRPGVNHDFFNQTSVLRTILHIFGLSPMNQQDARSPLMASCFDDEPNLAPFNRLEANVPLNQRPQDVQKQSSVERKWRRILATVPIERTGMKTEEDEDNLNRFVWHEMRGWDTPYPTAWSGGHGRGLPALGLATDPDADED